MLQFFQTGDQNKRSKELGMFETFSLFLILEFGGRERICKSEGGTCGLRTSNGEN